MVLFINSDNDICRVQIIVKAGDIVENNDKLSGISHLIEHILLDSLKECEGSCTKKFRHDAIIFNANTSAVLVTYFAYGPSKYLDKMLNYMLDITSIPVITDTIIEKAKIAVREELLSYLNQKIWKLNNELFQLLFKGSNVRNKNNMQLQYDNLESVTKEDIQDFFQKYYSDIYYIVYCKKEYFNDILKNYKFKERVPNKLHYEKIMKSPSIHELVYDTSATKSDIIVAYSSYTYNIMSEEVEYLSIIKEFLTGDIGSYLYRLRTEYDLIYNITMYYEMTPKGVYTIIKTSSKNAKECMEKLFMLLDGLVNDLNDEELLFNKYKEKILTMHKESCMKSDYMCTLYSFNYVYNRKLYNPQELIQLIIDLKYDTFMKIIKNLITPIRTIVYSP